MKLLWMLIIIMLSHIFSIPLWGWNITHQYILDEFPLRSNIDYITNACGNGYHTEEGTYGFACPHMMMFSEDMILASKYDHLSDYFYYATAGSNTDNECGKCFHVRVEKNSLHPLHNLIVQVINSGGDVGFRQFDLFMGAGGFGVFTACNSDCPYRACNGGTCHDSLYTGSFTDWTPTGDCYGGGVRVQDPLELKKACHNLFKNEVATIYKNVQLNQSCFFSNHYGYHQNFHYYESTRVQCPPGLYKLTGLRRADDDQYPFPSKEESYILNEVCNNNNCITTMCDCCKPSCGWSNKGHPGSEWPFVRTCDKFGFPF